MVFAGKEEEFCNGIRTAVFMFVENRRGFTEESCPAGTGESSADSGAKAVD